MAFLLISAPLLTGCAAQIQKTEVGENAEQAPKNVLVFQSGNLTPKDGVQLIDASLLAPGDIILSTSKGLVSMGVRLVTFAPVSHSVLYVGQGNIVEAMAGKGVRIRPLQEALAENTVTVAFRTPDLPPEQAQQVCDYAVAQVGKKYNNFGVLLQAPFALEKRFCELPVLTENLRDLCIRGVATSQFWTVSNKRFFCSQLLLDAYRNAGVPITDADPRWISPADILHMREGDVSSVRPHQALIYVGHLKLGKPQTIEEKQQATSLQTVD